MYRCGRCKEWVNDGEVYQFMSPRRPKRIFLSIQMCLDCKEKIVAFMKGKPKT